MCRKTDEKSLKMQIILYRNYYLLKIFIAMESHMHTHTQTNHVKRTRIKSGLDKLITKILNTTNY